jgi:outer membrane protein assembly factor BamB
MKPKIISCCTIILLLLVCWGCSTNPTGKSSAGEWTFFRGDAAMSGYTTIRLPDNPALLWTYKSELRTSSSPLVYHGTVYWSDRRGRIQGVDSRGNLCFTYAFETAVEATPIIEDSVLYIGRIDGTMSALSLATKDTIWNFETWGQISASPNIVNFEGRKAIVVGSYDNYLYCLDIRDGTEINRFESGYYINGAVAQWKDCVIFGGCDGWVRIVDCSTGIQTDSLETEAYIPASPAVSGDYCYIADYSGNIYELFLRNGKFERTKKIVESQSESSTFVSVPAVSDKTLFVVSDDRYVYAINRTDGAVNWKYLLKGNTGESSPVVCRDKVIVCTKTGIVSILDAQKGTLLWEYDTGEQITASPAVIKGRFYILTARGTLFCFGE